MNMMKSLTIVAMTAAALTTAVLATTGEASAFGRNRGFGGPGHFGGFLPARQLGLHDFRFRYSSAGWGYGRGWCYWHPYACYYKYAGSASSR
jgi:hypothetical protein